MTREYQVEKMLDELEEEFAKANMPVNDKLTLFAKVSNIIYKYAEQEPCTDAISRQAAIDTIESWLSCDDYNDAERHIMRAMQSVLYDLPPVTPAEKVGRWIIKMRVNRKIMVAGVKTWYLLMMCDKCGFIKTIMEEHKEQYKFCPNCGAKMQEVE